MEIAQLREQIDQQLVDQFKRRRPDDPAVSLRKTLVDELIQLDEEGRDIEAVRAEVEAADVLSMDAATAEAYLARLEDAPPRPDFPFVEPSDLAGIQAARPASRPVPPADDDDYERRLRGAWVGRCAGCTLGKPVEGWSRAEIRELLDTADIGDLRFYVPYLDPNPTGRAWHPSAVYSAQGRIDGVPRDDDIDYCVLALEILETYGADVTTADFGQAWLELLPLLAGVHGRARRLPHPGARAAHQPGSLGSEPISRNGLARRFAPTCWGMCIRDVRKQPRRWRIEMLPFPMSRTGSTARCGPRPPSRRPSAWTTRWKPYAPGWNRFQPTAGCTRR